MAKPIFSSYCSFSAHAETGSVHKHYHDHEYGFPLDSDDQLFGRMILEINQAGLSWDTILKKKENFFNAYDGFKIQVVAQYGENERKRLLGDAGIIRNRLKVDAAIENAKRIGIIQQEHGSFQNWLAVHHPKTKDEWTKLFKQQFKFMGGEIVNEFLMSTGYLPGAHVEDCPVYKKVMKSKPAWALKKRKAKKLDLV